jgi:predicted AAA+ superfamily ATPase
MRVDWFNMRRFAEKYLNEWLRRKRRKVLVVRGARQVGKSTMVRQFAIAANRDLIEINLERHVILALKQEGVQLAEILQEIEIISKKKITDSTLLFLDEIQAQPKMLQVLRYIYEERPDLPTIAAGSLLDFAIEDEKIAMPVGRIEYLHLGPMCFSEFVEATNDPVILAVLQNFSIENPVLAEGAMNRLTEMYRDYLYVGGMPEAVLSFIESKDRENVRRVQENLLYTYQDDFHKYSKRLQTDRVRKVFRYVPANCGLKLKFSNIDRDEKSRDLRVALDMLIKAKVVLPVYHSNSSGLPLSAQADETVCKLYFIDVGLMNAAMGISWDTFVLSGRASGLSKGAMAEQFVAQHLYHNTRTFSEPKLFYWLRDKSSAKAEVDFVIEMNGKIVPVEVKAEKPGRMKSLSMFVAEKKSNLAISLGLDLPKSIHRKAADSNYRLISLPLFLVEKLF